MRLTFLFLLISLSLQAQKIKFGKVSADDLKLEACSFEPDAGAVVLSDVGNAYLTFSPTVGAQYVYSRHVRIKIFNSSAYDEADISIPVYVGDVDGYYSLDQLKAHTLISTNGKDVEKIPVEKNQIFEEYTTERWKNIKFAFPAVDDNCIIEYKYRIVSSSLLAVSNWQMQGNIPTRYSTFSCEIPNFINSQVNITGQSASLVKMTESTQTRSDVLMNSYTFEAENIPGLTYEKYGTSLRNFATQARIVLMSVSVPGQTTRFLDGNYDEMNEQWLRYERMSILGKKKGFLEDAAATIPDGDSELETIHNVVSALQKNALYNDIIDVYPNLYVREIFNGKPANSAAMNMALIMLLQHKGIDAQPLLTSTRDFFRPHPVYPSSSEFNQLLTVITLANGKHYFVNAVSPLNNGDIRPEDINKLGWKLADPRGELIDLEKEVKASIFAKTTYTLEDGAINCSSEVTTNHLGVHLVTDGATIDQAKFAEQLKSSFDNVESVEVDGPSNRTKATITFAKENVADKQTIYIDPLYFGLLDFDVFKPEFRASPIDFPYQNSIVNTIEFMVPDGYKIESLPESVQLMNPDKTVKCTLMASAAENKISINLRMKISKNFFLPLEYADLRSFMNHIDGKLKEKIVLIKTAE